MSLSLTRGGHRPRVAVALGLVVAGLLTTVGALIGAVPAMASTATAVTKVSATSVSNSWTCGNTEQWSANDIKSVSENHSKVNVRSGPGTNCNVVGTVSTGYTLWYDCGLSAQEVNGNDGWTHLHWWTGSGTFHEGWVTDTLLPGDGSGSYCSAE